MNMTETTVLIRFIAAACPAQKFDEYTADAWSEALADVDAGDAKLATVKLVRDQPFISCSDIVNGVRDIRKRRLDAFGDIGTAPAEILDDANAWVAWTRERREDIKSGRLTRDNDPLRELMALEPPKPNTSTGWWDN